MKLKLKPVSCFHIKAFLYFPFFTLPLHLSSFPPFLHLTQVYRKGTVLYKSKAVSSTDSAETETSSDASSAAPPADSINRNNDIPTDDSTLPTPPTAPSSKQSKKQKTSSKNKSEKTVVYNVIESNCDIISDAFWESECLLTNFGCSERPFPKRNIAIDRMEDFAKW